MPFNRPIGTTTSIFRGDYSPDSPDAIRLLQGTGVTHIEYFCDEGVPNNSDPSHLALVKQTAADSGVTIWSVHAPFPQTDISDVDEGFRTASVGRVVEALDVAAALGAGRVVVHGSREPITDEQIEAVARSLHETPNPWFVAHGSWEAAGFEIKQAFRASARTALHHMANI